MILQVRAHAGAIERHRNAELAQLLRRADAREQQELRRADRAGGEHDLAAATRLLGDAVAAPAHARGAAAVEDYGFDQTIGQKPQVRPPERRLEKAARRRPAPPTPLVDVEIGAAFVVAAVEVLDRRNADLRGRGAHRVGEVPAYARRLDAPFAARRVTRAVAQEMILVALEERQNVVPAPAGP